MGYIFPATARLFLKFKIDLPPMTKATLALSDFITSNIWLIFIAMTVPTVLADPVLHHGTAGGIVLDRYIWMVPVIGPLLHKTSIEIFCRVFYALYSGSGENIDIIRLAAEACGNRYMEDQIKTVALPMMIQKGAGITEAFEAAGVFTKTASRTIPLRRGDGDRQDTRPCSWRSTTRRKRRTRCGTRSTSFSSGSRWSSWSS